MINNNEQDRIDMAEEISKIRLSGKVNMYNRKEVINELVALGYDTCRGRTFFINM